MKITKLDFSQRPLKAKNAVEEILKPTSPNLYIAPEAGRLLLSHALAKQPKTFELEKPIRLATGWTNALLDPRVKLITKSTGYLGDFGSKAIEAGYPTTAASLQAVSILVGGYGCVERLLKPEKYNRWRVGFSLLDFILSVLNFLGKYVPQLKSASIWFLAVKAIGKIGDEVAEYNFNTREKREILRVIESTSDLTTKTEAR
jgi:hypothetical protein